MKKSETDKTAADKNRAASDQDTFTRGVRDMAGQDKTDDGNFYEVEQGPMHRRDLEESRHDEAGRQIQTQGDEEFEKLNNANPEGKKISNSRPQTSL